MIVELVEYSKGLSIDGHKHIYADIDNVNTFTDASNRDFINMYRSKELLYTLPLNRIPTDEEVELKILDKESRPSLYAGVFLLNNQGQTIERIR